jgi:hypothetical protein
MATVARKHIMAAIEAAPCELDFPKYTISASLYRLPRKGGVKGVRVVWRMKEKNSGR